MLQLHAQDFSYLDDFFINTLGVIDTVVPVLIALALLFFLWGLVVFIAQSGNEQATTQGKQKMIWGLIALFVLVSVWGIVNILIGIFLPSTDLDPNDVPWTLPPH